MLNLLYKRKFLQIKLGGIAAIPFLLYLLPRSVIFSGEHPICLFKNLLGTECWGCGITRAVLSVMYLDFSGAWEYNHFVVVVFPLLVYLWVRWLRSTYKQLKNNTSKENILYGETHH